MVIIFYLYVCLHRYTFRAHRTYQYYTTYPGIIQIIFDLDPNLLVIT